VCIGAKGVQREYIAFNSQLPNPAKPNEDVRNGEKLLLMIRPLIVKGSNPMTSLDIHKRLVVTRRKSICSLRRLRGPACPNIFDWIIMDYISWILYPFAKGKY